MQSTTFEGKSNDAVEASDTKEQESRQPIDELHELHELHELKERLDLFNERVKAFIKERPAVCLAGAVALGYLIARIARRRS